MQKKKILLTMILMILLFDLTGCSDKLKEKDTNNKEDILIPSTSEIDKSTETDTENTEIENNTNQKLVCTSSDFYGNGDNVIYKGEFYYEDGKITKYEYRLTVPSKYDPNEYYIEEQKSNMGRFEMSLDGREIVNVLTPNWSYWNDWPNKDKKIDEIIKIYEDINTKCVIE